MVDKSHSYSYAVFTVGAAQSYLKIYRRCTFYRFVFFGCNFCSKMNPNDLTLGGKRRKRTNLRISSATYT